MQRGPTRYAERIRMAFWLLPVLCCAAALVLALLLSKLDEHVSDDLPFLFPGGPDGARAVLSAIVTAMISFTGLVFSITVVSLQLASSQFSPRVLRTFLRSRVTQMALGVFTATFVYAITVLREVRGGIDGAPPFVPQTAVTTATLLVLISVGMFLAYIQHMTQTIRVSNVIRSVGEETRALLSTTDNEQHTELASEVIWPGDPHVLGAPTSGVLVRIDHEALISTATGHGMAVAVLAPIGTYLPEGMPLLGLYGDPQDSAGEGPGAVELNQALRQDVERTMEQDVAFGLRQLVDIAERALSPGINDPTTAIQALDEIHDLLRRLVQRANQQQVWRDEDGNVRLTVPTPTFSELLDLAVDEIATYGSDSKRVQSRIESMLDDLLTVSLPGHRAAVLAKSASLSS